MATQTYYNGIGAVLFAYAPDNQLGDYLDIVTIQYNENQNKLPIYGYKSYRWDSVLYGDIVVQGSFSLNKKDAVTLHRYIGNNGHPETGKLPVNLKENLITESKFMIKIKHRTHIMEAAPSYKKIDTKAVFTLEDVEITSIEHSISPDGNPIGEFYTFVAKRVQDTPSTNDLFKGAPV